MVGEAYPKQLLDEAWSASPPAPGQVIVDLEELNLGRRSDADLRIDRTELLAPEFLECFSRLPYVDDAESVVGLRDPVKELLGRSGPPGQKADSLVHLVVLLDRDSPKVELHCNDHVNPLFERPDSGDEPQRRCNPPLLHATHKRAYGRTRSLALGIA